MATIEFSILHDLHKYVPSIPEPTTWGEFSTRSIQITRTDGSVGPQSDPRFTLHHRQPRADKLDAHQRRLCHADPAFLDALRARVTSPARFAAFLDGTPFYVALERPCVKCGGYKRRVRDRSCYPCHVRRSGENFERMKAGLAPMTMHSKDGYLDVLERKRREQEGDYLEREFDGLLARRWPLGRLDVTFPDGYREPDLSKLNYHGLCQALIEFPALRDALVWAGWPVPACAP